MTTGCENEINLLFTQCDSTEPLNVYSKGGVDLLAMENNDVKNSLHNDTTNSIIEKRKFYSQQHDEMCADDSAPCEKKIKILPVNSSSSNLTPQNGSSNINMESSLNMNEKINNDRKLDSFQCLLKEAKNYEFDVDQVSLSIDLQDKEKNSSPTEHVKLSSCNDSIISKIFLTNSTRQHDADVDLDSTPWLLAPLERFNILLRQKLSLHLNHSIKQLLTNQSTVCHNLIVLSKQTRNLNTRIDALEKVQKKQQSLVSAAASVATGGAALILTDEVPVMIVTTASPSATITSSAKTALTSVSSPSRSQLLTNGTVSSNVPIHRQRAITPVKSVAPRVDSSGVTPSMQRHLNGRLSMQNNAHSVLNTTRRSITSSSPLTSTANGFSAGTNCSSAESPAVISIDLTDDSLVSSRSAPSSVASKANSSNAERPSAQALTRVLPSLLRHPAPLPALPIESISGKRAGLPPPAAQLSISRVREGIVLQWNILDFESDKYAPVDVYEIFNYQQRQEIAPNSSLWSKIGDVNALPLPMMCTLTQVVDDNIYHFAVRAVDCYHRIGLWSNPVSIHLVSA